MPLPEAAFSGYMTTFLADSGIASAFSGGILRREVNPLKLEAHPVLAVWVEGGGRTDEFGSDGEFSHGIDYSAMVYTRLADGEAQDAAIDRADRALYRAKQAGRNRVEVALQAA